jgi:hypothetical protein
MYLVCDPSTPPDAEFAANLRLRIEEREPEIDVLLPDTSANAQDLHFARLRGCDGMLLYREAAPSDWLRQNAPHVVLAEETLKREKPPAARAFLLDDPSLLERLAAIKQVPIILRRDPFRIEHLEAFLAPLREVARIRHAGA